MSEAQEFAIQSYRSLLAVFFVLSVLAPNVAQATALTLTPSLALAQYQGTAPESIQLSATAADFTVNAGDTVEVTFLFPDDEFFQLILNPLGQPIGTAGALRIADSQPSYIAEFKFGFAFVGLDGSDLLFGFESGREARGGGDLHGDVTLIGSRMDVAGVRITFSDIQNVATGGLPVVFNGASFSVYGDVHFGSPFSAPSNSEPLALPEPATLLLVSTGALGLLAGSRWAGRS